MEKLSWIRQWSQSEHNSIDIPSYTDFWVKGMGAKGTPTWVGVETYDECTHIIIIRNRDDMSCSIEVLRIVPDVEETIKIVKTQLSKVEGVTPCTREEFIEQLDNVNDEVINLEHLKGREVDIPFEDDED